CLERAVAHRRHGFEQRSRQHKIGTIDRLLPDSPRHWRGGEAEAVHTVAFAAARRANPKRTAPRDAAIVCRKANASASTSREAASSIDASAFTSGVIPNLICV